MYERRIENSLYKTLLEFQRLHLIKKMDMESESKATPTLGMSDKRQAAYDTRPATYDTRPTPVRHSLPVLRSESVEGSEGGKDKLCETNPIPQKPKMKLTPYPTNDYENKSDLLTPEKQTQPALSEAEGQVEGPVVSKVEPPALPVPTRPEFNRRSAVEGSVVEGSVVEGLVVLASAVVSP